MKRLPIKLEAEMLATLARNNNERNSKPEPKQIKSPDKVTIVEGQLVFPLPKKEEE